MEAAITRATVRTTLGGSERVRVESTTQSYIKWDITPPLVRLRAALLAPS